MRHREYPWEFRTGLILCGGFQRGRCPLCVVAGVGYIGAGPHRKGPAPMRFFGYFLSVQKVTRGSGAEPPQRSGSGGGAPAKAASRIAAIRGEICFSPARPAAHESEPIGALRWHNAHLNEERSPVQKIKKLYLGENKSKFLLKTPACVVY